MQNAIISPHLLRLCTLPVSDTVPNTEGEDEILLTWDTSCCIIIHGLDLSIINYFDLLPSPIHQWHWVLKMMRYITHELGLPWNFSQKTERYCLNL